MAHVESKPAVVIAVQVRPKNTEYIVLSVMVNGAIADSNRIVNGDFGCTVPADLVGRSMEVRVTVASLQKQKIKAFVSVWSSRGVDDPTTIVDERWKQLGKPKSGDGKITIKGEFDAYTGNVQ